MTAAMQRANELQGAIGAPRLGFFGVIDERLDLDLVARVADADPAWQIVMVGPVVKIDAAALPRRANLHWLGQQPYSLLPQLVAGWDVCLHAVRAQRVDRVHQPDQDARVHGGRQAGRLDADPRRQGRCSATSSRSPRRPTISSLPAVPRWPSRRRRRGERAARAQAIVAEHSWDAAAETIRRSLAAVLAAPRVNATGVPSTVAAANRRERRAPRRSGAGRGRGRAIARRGGARRQARDGGLSHDIAPSRPPRGGHACNSRGKIPATPRARAGSLARGPQNRSDRHRRATGDRLGFPPPPSPASARALDVVERPLALPLRRRAQAPAPVRDRALAAADRGAVPARVEGERHRRHAAFIPCCWYEREFELLPDRRAGRSCTSAPSTTPRSVWVNGHLAATHEGGHTPFSADITALLDRLGRADA